MSQTGEKMITMLVLTNVSRSTYNQTMKFGQFIEYKINIFFEKS